MLDIRVAQCLRWIVLPQNPTFFYNWSAAIATNDSSSYGAYDSGADSYINTETNQSICPTGWTLPIGGYLDSNAPSKSLQYLVEQYGWDNNSYALSKDRKIWESPIYLGLSGFWHGDLGNVGYYVPLWSSVTIDGYDTYNSFTYSDGDVSPDDYYYRNFGYVVRCVARWQFPFREVSLPFKKLKEFS